MLTTLVPFKVRIVALALELTLTIPGQNENATLEVLLSPGLTYAFEVTGGGG